MTNDDSSINKGENSINGSKFINLNLSQSDISFIDNRSQIFIEIPLIEDIDASLTQNANVLNG